MTVKIGHSSIDENGHITGGKAGDQTGREVYITNWYKKGWTVLLRPKDLGVAERMARACEAGCANDNIGYDQNQRNTLRVRAREAGWDLSKITTPCECDCSSFMAVCAEAAGVNMDVAYSSGNAPATRYMRERFLKTGAFDALTDKKYLTQSDYLRRGDILVYEGHHTVMVLSDGEKEDENMDVKKFRELYREMRRENQDNDAGGWSGSSRDWATSNKLIQGNGLTADGEPNYMWEDVMTREQLVEVLYRFYRIFGAG